MVAYIYTCSNVCMQMLMVILIYFLPALTILNTAPGVESLSEEFYSNTDILCLNETEVSG